MIQCFQFCFNFAFKLDLRRYNEGTAALRTLSLSGCGCGPAGAIALGTALELNTSLTRYGRAHVRSGQGPVE